MNNASSQSVARYGAVSQEHALGCAISCVASRCGLAYEAARALFARPESAWTVGYCCDEVVEALAKAGHAYGFERYEPASHDAALEREGTIVFVGPCADYPAGHYLLRAQEGWMNSWLNFPRMIPVRSGFEHRLRGGVEYVIYEGAEEPSGGLSG